MRRTILFDLDGTLTDPKPGILNAVRYALDRMSMNHPDPDHLLSFIGPPLQHSFVEHCGLSVDEAWRAVSHYREYYREKGLYENELYPGIRELLLRLHSQGERLMIATSKLAVFAESIARHLGIADCFDGIYGSELDGTRSDKGELIAYIQRIHRLSPGDCVMVGDREHDIRGARANGIPAIAVGYGYGHEQVLRREGPIYYAKTVNELAKHLAGFGV